MNPIQRYPSLSAVAFVVLGALWGTLVPGCSSDEFSPTGSDFPADVRQDSLLIPLNIVGTSEELRLDMPILNPPQGSSIELREVLYLGTLASTDWKATPFLRYAFILDDTVPLEELQADPSLITSIPVSFRMLRYDDSQGPASEFEVYELNTILDPSMATGPVSAYLGNLIGSYSDFRSEVLSFDLLEGKDDAGKLAVKQMVVGWMTAGEHNGIALVDTASDSSLIAVASIDFNESSHGSQLTFIDDDGITVPVVRPKITVNYTVPDVESDGVEFQSASDLTVIERNAAPSGLALGGYVATRSWFDFEFGELPRASTINGADLVLHFDRSRLAVAGIPGKQIEYERVEGTPIDIQERSLGDRSFEDSSLAPVSAVAVAYESYRSEAELLDTSSLTQARDALREYRPDWITSGEEEGDDVLRINITDFVQRVANRLFGGNVPGLLLTMTDEEFRLIEAVFFDSSAADSLRPRVEIRYTPPADFAP